MVSWAVPLFAGDMGGNPAGSAACAASTQAWPKLLRASRSARQVQVSAARACQGKRGTTCCCSTCTGPWHSSQELHRPVSPRTGIVEPAQAQSLLVYHFHTLLADGGFTVFGKSSTGKGAGLQRVLMPCLLMKAQGSRYAARLPGKQSAKHQSQREREREQGRQPCWLLAATLHEAEGR